MIKINFNFIVHSLDVKKSFILPINRARWSGDHPSVEMQSAYLKPPADWVITYLINCFISPYELLLLFCQFLLWCNFCYSWCCYCSYYYHYNKFDFFSFRNHRSMIHRFTASNTSNDLDGFLCLMAYQPSWVILSYSDLCRTVIIIIMSLHQRGSPWPNLATLLYRPSLLVGLQG